MASEPVSPGAAVKGHIWGVFAPVNRLLQFYVAFFVTCPKPTEIRGFTRSQ
jgi:hypothetical protein